jgi:phytoene dehydrogenase-like protein
MPSSGLATFLVSAILKATIQWPIIVAMEVLNHFLAGAYYPHAGSSTFRDAFLNALRNHGAKMKNKARVVRINKKGREFSVEIEPGQSFTTNVVISNADPVITLGKLADPRIVPFCFITSPSVKDPQREHAPQGRHTIELFTYINYSVLEKWRNAPSMKRGEEYNLLKEKMGKQLLKTAEKYIPRLSEHLDHVEYASPLSNEYWVNAVKGSVF